MKAQLSLFKDRLFSTRVNAFSAADLVQLVIAGKLSVPEEKLRQRFTNSELFLEVTCTLTHIQNNHPGIYFWGRHSTDYRRQC